MVILVPVGAAQWKRTDLWMSFAYSAVYAMQYLVLFLDTRPRTNGDALLPIVATANALGPVIIQRFRAVARVATATAGSVCGSQQDGRDGYSRFFFARPSTGLWRTRRYRSHPAATPHFWSDAGSGRQRAQPVVPVTPAFSVPALRISLRCWRNFLWRATWTTSAGFGFVVMNLSITPPAVSGAFCLL